MYTSLGELGWEIHHDAKDTGALYKKILEAGSDYEIGDYGTFATNSLRIEKGFRGWGAEVKSNFRFQMYTYLWTKILHYLSCLPHQQSV